MDFNRENKIDEKIERRINMDKGDGQPYLDMLEEEYKNMTEEEKKEVEAIGKMLDEKFGLDDEDDEIESYKGVDVGDTSYEALQNLLQNPIFKHEKIDFKEYYDKKDETDTIEGALEFLKSHASK